mmetsp:Transcript_57274/g.133948  ORF Transcript_57274/g.133948 Transcript_57274/m.133948 type:complete len:1188 (+) Transcript_57274:58-3621(+)
MSRPSRRAEMPKHVEMDDAFHALKSEIESFSELVTHKLKVLENTLTTLHEEDQAMQEERFMEADDAAAAAREPFALREYAENKKLEGDTPGPASRRFVGFTNQKKGVEIRLHGRWMELSNQSTDQSSVQKSLMLNRTVTRRMTEQVSSNGTINSVLQPGGTIRLIWDILGGCLLLLDATFLPISLAWDLDMRTPGAAGLLLSISFWTSFAFWSTDILVNFNTAVYIQGRLEILRKLIALHYLKTWLLFDVGLVTLDIISLGESYGHMGDLSTFRSLRVIRGLRLLRLLKAGRLRDLLQEWVASTGRQSILFYGAILNTAVLIIMVCHFLTCMWFGIGRSSDEAGTESWLAISLLHGIPAVTQYMHAFRYVIGAPSPPMVAPDNGLELFCDISINVLCLMVLGTAVSKISNTLAELRAMNEEHDRQRREIRMYLTGQSAPFELVSRIMKFVDYRLEKMAIHSFDQNLISKTLQTELYVNQRSPYLLQLPIFALCEAVFADVFADLCAVLQKRVFEKKEAVFVTGSYATAMEITASGSYSHVEGEKGAAFITGTECFQEACLYTDGLMHQSTLLCRTFAETLSLNGNDLVSCLKNSPGCCKMFIEYARDFVQSLQKSLSPFNHDTQVEAAETACLNNEYYQELYPDPRKMFGNIDTEALFRGEGEDEANSDLFSGLQDELSDRVEDSIPVMPRPSFTPKKARQSNWLTRKQDSAMLAILSASKKEAAKKATTFGLESLIQEIVSRELQCDDQELLYRMQRAMPELNAQLGPHVIFEQEAERDRAESSCYSILALLAGRYDTFTGPQAPNAKLQQHQWHGLQAIIDWITPTVDQVHGVLVLLAIRALGKSKMVLRQVPPHARRPERALLHLINSEQHLVPSVRFLSASALKFVQNALFVHEQFNLAQMLQGENVPGSVLTLQNLIKELGEEAFHFYILFLIGFMSGLAAGRGSRFLNSKNAEGVITGIRMLQQLLKGTPKGIYWGFLSARAQSLSLPKETAEDLVLVRIACLARITDQKGYVGLRASWDSLGHRERNTLTDHFLADGIEDRAYVFEFLPACVERAQKNPIIGLSMMLEVLVDLLSNLGLAMANLAIDPTQKIVYVDLSDMGEFVAVVQNRFVFQTCMARAKFHVVEDRVRVEMTGGNWARTGDVDSDMTTLSYSIKDVFMRQQALESLLRRHLSMSEADT